MAANKAAKSGFRRGAAPRHSGTAPGSEIRPAALSLGTIRRLSYLPMSFDASGRKPRMTSADHYRALAAQFDAKAKQEADWQVRAEWEHMARSYHRLAEQAER